MGVAILGNMKFTVGWLYPDLMNIYGDRGNILTLLRRAEWHGLEASGVEPGRGAPARKDEGGGFFFGGGPDPEPALIYDDPPAVQPASPPPTVPSGAPRPPALW